MQLLKSARLNFYFGCFTEAALVGVAAIVGWIFNYPIFRDLSWRSMDVVWGIAATVPMLAGFGWLLKSSGEFAADIRRFFEHVIRPVFGEWSLMQLAIVSILAGICEEVLFRGALQAGLSGKIGTAWSLIVASVAFGIGHPVSRQYVLAATVVGFFLGGLFIVRGNLLAPIVAHALYDFCALAWLLRLHRGDPR
jgi:CAAX protease family protein